MVSQLKVNEIIKQSGSSISIGESGDTINIGTTGDTINLAGSAYAAASNTPYFSVRQTGSVTVTDNTDTKVAWNSELVDSDSAFASDKFTVPSGKAGKYFLYTMGLGSGSANSYLNVYYLNIYKNGSRIAMSENDLRGNAGRKITSCVHTIQDLSAGDYIEVYVKVDINAGTAYFNGDDFQAMFGGFKLL
jgi:hypothetical protein